MVRMETRSLLKYSMLNKEPRHVSAMPAQARKISRANARSGCVVLALGLLTLGLVIQSAAAASSVVAWGRSVETNVPGGFGIGVAIAEGGGRSLALTADGHPVGWGDDGSGQTNIPSGLSNVVAVATGPHHSLALTADGQVVGWGYNRYGQTNIPGGLSNVVAIAAGGMHSLALTSD